MTPAEIILAARIGFDEEVLRAVKSILGRDIEPHHYHEGIDGSLVSYLADMETDGMGFTMKLADPYIGNNGCLMRQIDGYTDNHVDTWHVNDIHKVRGLLPAGYSAFLTEDCFSCPGVTVLKTTDPYDIIRVRHTQGWDFDDRNYYVEGLIEVLKKWQKKCCLDLIGAEYSEVKLLLNTLPDDLVAFAEEVNHLCPELDQLNNFGYYGAGSEQNRIVAEKLAASLRETRRLYLWWD